MIILYISLIAISLYVGLKISSNLKSSVHFLETMENFLVGYKHNVQYSSKSIVEYVSTQNFSNKYNLLIKSLVEQKLSGGKVKITTKLVTMEDKQKLEQMIDSLGKTDCFNESELVDRYIFEVKQMLKVYEKKYTKYGSVAIKLSILIGLMIVILLI